MIFVQYHKANKGFTLIELLVVIAIMGILSALLLPAVQAAREAARRAYCLNNLKQVGLALQNYHDDMGAFPMGYAARSPFVDGATDTAPGWGWGTMILPQLEQAPLFNSINFSLNIEASQNATALQTVIPQYLCPSDPTPTAPVPVFDTSGIPLVKTTVASYAACVGGDESDTATGINNDGIGRGIMYRNSSTRLADITDGTSQTIVVGERAWTISSGIWAGAIMNGVIRRGPADRCPLTGALFYPAATLVLAHSHLLNTDTDPDGGLDDFSSRHPGGANFLFADGSVRFFKNVLRDVGVKPNGDPIYSPSSVVFQAIGTRNCGEVISGDAF
jgi:prepilin-type N-terminal cleavage/methylation domain-containing protein/prepilin-type processing-associated H-X9-DG protein